MNTSRSGVGTIKGGEYLDVQFNLDDRARIRTSCVYFERRRANKVWRVGGSRTWAGVRISEWVGVQA